MPPPSLSALRATSSAKATRHFILTGLRLATGIGILVYLAKSGIISIGALAKLAVRWPITLGAMGVLLVDIFFMAVRASWLFRPLGMRLTILRSMQLTLLSLFFSTFLPGTGGGDLVKLYYATKENARRRATITTILLFDRVMGFFALLVLPLVFAPFFLSLLHAVPALRAILIGMGCISGGLLAGFLLCAFPGRIRQLLVRDALPPRAWRNVAGEVLESISSLGGSPGTLIMALILSLLANLSLIAVTALAFLALDPTGLAAKMCLVIPIGHVVNSLPLTPGGLGVGETAFNALFEMTGLHGGAEALLCWRVWKALVGLLGLVIYARGVRGQMFDSEPSAKEPTAVAT